MNGTLTQPGARRTIGRGALCGLWLAAAVGLAFVVTAALPYLFRITPEQFRWYWPRRWWLLLHIVTGAVALLTGPVQLWLGLAQRHVDRHRLLGVVYLGSVTVGAFTAYVLVLETDFGWVFGAGLAGLATAWLVTSGLAVVAIRRRLYEQHQEWMIRSYVVTTAFVTFRVLFSALKAAGVGSLNEQLAACSWFCWAVPLLVTEAVLQGRKMRLRVRPGE